MDLELGVYYNIIEPYTEEYRDVGSYLYNHGIRYSLRISTERDGIPDANWMVTMKPQTVVIYTARMTEEDMVVLKLIFPHIVIKKPVMKESIHVMVKRILPS